MKYHVTDSIQGLLDAKGVFVVNRVEVCGHLTSRNQIRGAGETDRERMKAGQVGCTGIKGVVDRVCKTALTLFGYLCECRDPEGPPYQSRLKDFEQFLDWCDRVLETVK